jgi:uncharacterized protein YggU (UPF0235/DUF167 family)
MAGWWRSEARGPVMMLRVTPNAGRDAVDGAVRRDDGSVVLGVRVRAVPDKGRANAAVLALLADRLGCPKSRFEIVAGETARLKSVLWREAPDDAADRLDALAGAERS